MLPKFIFPMSKLSKMSVLAKFSTWWPRMSGFCQISSFAGLLSGEKCHFWAKFSTWIKFSGFCQISFFAGLLVKNVNFEQKNQGNSKFLDLAKFHFSQVPSGQTLNFDPNFHRDWKFLNFAKFHPSHVLRDQKCRFYWAKFSTQLKIAGFFQILSFAGP